jgi:hypothetical protein
MLINALNDRGVFSYLEDLLRLSVAEVTGQNMEPLFSTEIEVTTKEEKQVGLRREDFGVSLECANTMYSC